MKNQIVFLFLITYFLADIFADGAPTNAPKNTSGSSPPSSLPRVTGLAPVGGDAAEIDAVAIYVVENEATTLRVYGVNLNIRGLKVALDERAGDAGDSCDHRLEEFLPQTMEDVEDDGLSATIVLKLSRNDDAVFVCLKTNDSDSFVHQGRLPRLAIKTKAKYLMPLWLQIAIICILLIMSGLFSGLNLGLMALDKTELKIVENCGTPKEKQFARTIGPVRERGNFLLCTLLLSNVLVNNTFTILMDQLTGGGGVIAVIGATLGIVVCGEIIPQAICSRHGLAVGARTIWITKIFMLLTFPLSFPISLLLDKILGEELGTVYDREKLRELLKVTYGQNDLQRDEMKIITGALDLSKKSVADIMTPKVDVFMISYDAILDFNTMSNIMKRGYSRIPVYEPETTDVRWLLSIKDLAFVDPDDCIPLKTICDFYQHQLIPVRKSTKLDDMLEEFKKGKCHMAVVVETEVPSPEEDKKAGAPTDAVDGVVFSSVAVEAEEKADGKSAKKDEKSEKKKNGKDSKSESDSTMPKPTTDNMLGIVTLEDVIEEIIQAEILDETDVVTDNRRKARRSAPARTDFTAFNNDDDGEAAPRLTPQLSLAVFQFLSANVDPFRETRLSANVLRRLIKQPRLVVDVGFDPARPSFVYERGVPSDFFALVLQGSVEVCIGNESLVFETGPFSFFGADALGVEKGAGRANSPRAVPRYVPDFSLRPTSEVQMLKIRASDYEAARKATTLERQASINRGGGGTAASPDAAKRLSAKPSVDEDVFVSVSAESDLDDLDEASRSSAPLLTPTGNGKVAK